MADYKFDLKHGDKLKCAISDKVPATAKVEYKGSNIDTLLKITKDASSTADNIVLKFELLGTPGHYTAFNHANDNKLTFEVSADGYEKSEIVKSLELTVVE